MVILTILSYQTTIKIEKDYLSYFLKSLGLYLVKVGASTPEGEQWTLTILFFPNQVFLPSPSNPLILITLQLKFSALNKKYLGGALSIDKGTDITPPPPNNADKEIRFLRFWENNIKNFRYLI